MSFALYFPLLIDYQTHNINHINKAIYIEYTVILPDILIFLLPLLVARVIRARPFH